MVFTEHSQDHGRFGCGCVVGVMLVCGRGCVVGVMLVCGRGVVGVLVVCGCGVLSVSCKYVGVVCCWCHVSVWVWCVVGVLVVCGCGVLLVSC